MRVDLYITRRLYSSKHIPEFHRQAALPNSYPTAVMLPCHEARQFVQFYDADNALEWINRSTSLSGVPFYKYSSICSTVHVQSSYINESRPESTSLLQNVNIFI